MFEVIKRVESSATFNSQIVQNVLYKEPLLSAFLSRRVVALGVCTVLVLAVFSVNQLMNTPSTASSDELIKAYAQMDAAWAPEPQWTIAYAD